MTTPEDTTNDQDHGATPLDVPDPAQRFGAAAAADAEVADRVAADAGEDLERAEARFDEAARRPAPTETGHPRE